MGIREEIHQRIGQRVTEREAAARHNKRPPGSTLLPCRNKARAPDPESEGEAS